MAARGGKKGKMGPGGELKQSILLAVRWDYDASGFNVIKRQLQELNKLSGGLGGAGARVAQSATSRGGGYGGLGSIYVATMHVRAATVIIQGGGGGGGPVSPVFGSGYAGGAGAGLGHAAVSGPHAGGVVKTSQRFGPGGESKGGSVVTGDRYGYRTTRSNAEGAVTGYTDVDRVAARSLSETRSKISDIRSSLANRLREARSSGASRSSLAGIYSQAQSAMGAIGTDDSSRMAGTFGSYASALRSGAPLNPERSRAAMSRMMSGVIGRASRGREAYRDSVRAEQAEVMRGAMASGRSANVGLGAHEDMMERLRARRVRDYEAELENRARVHQKQQRILEKARAGSNMAAPIPAWRKSWGGPTGVLSAGNIMGQMGANFAKVTAWGLPAFAMTAGIGAATGAAAGAVGSASGTSMQTARLGQVFRGVGGDARQLTSDVLRLAAAEGRARDEAMESAIQWARTGTTRKETAEAVRVSLMAANVAEISAADATEKLQAVQKAYGLQVRELAGVLGMLNSVSNTYNATNADMLIGLTRTASVAKQAGVPLAELVGMLGAAIGGTGQSGANIGNAIKSILTAMNNPEMQDFLESRYGLKASSGGQMKSGSQRMSELWGVYRGLDKKEQGNILFRVAGKTQSSRMAALMDTHVTGQVLGIQAQRNIGSAEVESTKIRAELTSKWQGLISQSEALINAMNQASGATSALAIVAGAASGALRIAQLGVNQPLISRGIGKMPTGIIMGLLNQYGMNTPEARSQKFNQVLEQKRGMASSAQQAESLFRSAASGKALSGDEAEWIAKIMDSQTGSKFLAASRRGDLSGMRAALLSAASREQGLGQGYRSDVDAATKAEVSRLDREIEFAKGGGNNRGLAELQASRRSILMRGKAYHDESLADEVGTSQGQRSLNASAALRYRIGAAATGDSITATGSLMNELRTLRKREQILMGEQGTADASRSEDVNRQLRETQAEIAGRVGLKGGYGPSSGMVSAMDKDRRSVVGAFVGAGIDQAGTGRDSVAIYENKVKEAEKLQKLTEAILATSQDEVELQNTQLAQNALRERRERLILERVQTRVAAVKEEYEANRRLMTLGPSGLLTQLVGMRLNQANPGIGGRLAFSPDVRDAMDEASDRDRRRKFIENQPTINDTLQELSNNAIGKLMENAADGAAAVGTLTTAFQKATEWFDAFVASRANLGNVQPQTPAGPPVVSQAPSSGMFEGAVSAAATIGRYLLPGR